MNKKLFCIVCLAASFLFGSTVFADDLDSICGNHMENLVTNLHLNAEQQKKITVIKDQLKSSQMNNWQKLTELGNQITQQIYSDALHSAKLETLVKQQSQLIGDTIKAKAIAENKIYAVLNSEQKPQYVQMVKQREGKIRTLFKKCDE